MDIGKIQPKEIVEEMRESYLGYAMSVIVSRALPDVRDGLKPVHRRILYTMHEMGLRHNVKFRKSAAVVGDVLGKYHPHGDTAVYDAMARLAQDFSLRYPLVDGQGNWGSVDGDSPAAMRYCLTGDTFVPTSKGIERIAEISTDKSERINTQIISRDAKINQAVKWFDSGIHPTLKISTKRGYSVQGSYNHPILIWDKNPLTDQPTYRWKLLSQVEKGDIAVIDRSRDLLWPLEELSLRSYYPSKLHPRAHKKNLPKTLDQDLAYILGALVAEGTIREKEIEFCNSDKAWIEEFEYKWRNVFPDCRLHKFLRKPSSFGKKPYYTLEVHSTHVVEFLRNLGLGPDVSRNKIVPKTIFKSPKHVVVAFLRSYFEGDGSVSRSEKMNELSAISVSRSLIQELQILLLRFGVATSYYFDKHRKTHKLYIRGLGDYTLFQQEIGFVSARKQGKLKFIIENLKKDYSQTDFVPYIQEYIRGNLSGKYRIREYAIKQNFNRYPNMTEKYETVATLVKPALQNSVIEMFEDILAKGYLFDEIKTIEHAGEERVYSLKVDSDCHSFVGNGFINHNTEARMTKIAEEMLKDIDKDTVEWVDNYDSTRKEPKVLPASVPQLLVNGTMGIAVGMATNIPPHNISETIDGLIYLIDNPKATVPDLMKLIKGPDFPTGGVIFGKKSMREAYVQGRGPIAMRGVAEIKEKEERKGMSGAFIEITEIPYQVNKSALIEKIADLVKDGKIEGIKDIRDESDRDGMSIIIELKKDAYPQKILNSLYKFTELQKTFHLNMLALADGIQPQVLSLRDVLEKYFEHRKEVVRKRIDFDLARAKERAHILEGLKKALNQIDAVIKAIKASLDRNDAHLNLRKKFKFTDGQATAILEMRLQTLANLERKKIDDELKEKRKIIRELSLLLRNTKAFLKFIREEFVAMKVAYGDKRKTQIVAAGVEEIQEEDIIPKEETIISLTRGGYIKRVSPSAYKTQKRGGKGIIGMETRGEDVVEHFLYASTHDRLLFFTSQGKVYQTLAYEIPKSTRVGRGRALVNFLDLAREDFVTAVLSLERLGQEEGSGTLPPKFLIMATKHGIIKKVSLEDFKNVRRSGILAIHLKKGDMLGWVDVTHGKSDILLATQHGQAIRFHESDVRPMGRSATGVRAINLKQEDEVISMSVISKEHKRILLVSENGFGKRSALSLFKVQKRGGSGIKAAKVTAKTGKIIYGAILKGEEEELIIVSQGGHVIRTLLKNISILGRATQGVKVMKLSQEDKVASGIIV